MSHTPLPLASLLVLLIGLCATAAGQGYVEQQVVVRLNADLDLDSVAASQSFHVLGQISSANIGLFSSDQIPLQTMLLILSNLSGVIYAEPNYLIGTPESEQKSEGFVDLTDPNFIEGSEPVQYYQQSAASQIELTSAQAHTLGGGTLVAVIDGGVDFDHPALAGRFSALGGYDFLNGDDLPEEEPGGSAYGHGTFVASTISLVAPDADLLIIRALDTAGVGTAFAVVQSIYYAAVAGADVINLSLGMTTNSAGLADAVDYALSQGAVVVSSAGNTSAETPRYPAAYNGVIAVTTVDSLDIKSTYSGYGEWVTLSAPGDQIYAALPDDRFGWWDGTSFGAALVSGAAALLHSASTSLTAAAMQSLLTQTSTPIDALNPAYAGLLGSGRLNIGAAISLVTSTALCGDADGSGLVTVSDAVYLVNYIFAEGFAPTPLAAGDTDCSGIVTISDAVYLINYIFGSGPQPCAACP